MHTIRRPFALLVVLALATPAGVANAEAPPSWVVTAAALSGPPHEGSACAAMFDRTSCGPGLLCVEHRCQRMAPPEPAAPRVVALAPSPWAAGEERRHTIALNGGFASVVGFVGATYAYRPMPWLELEGGFGWGVSGLQFSFMPRLSVGSNSDRFAAGAGLSVSAPVGSTPFETPALWLNVDVASYEFRAHRGFFFMVAAGLFVGLAGRYQFDADSSVTGILFFQGRVAIGWSF